MITINGLNHYQELSQRTANTHDYELANYGLGAAGEAGEVAALVLRKNKDLKVFSNDFKKELGDVLWYVSQIARIAGLSLEELRMKNSYDSSVKKIGLRLSTSCGEVADLIKKHVFHGHNIEKEVIKEVLSDVLSYIFTIGKLLDLEILDIAAANIEKLMARYPKGFSKERSINREE